MESMRHIDMHYRPVSYASRRDWEAYARWLRRHIAVSQGLLPGPAAPALKPLVFGRWEGDGYMCEKVALETLPGFFATGNLFRPLARARGRMPVVLCPHGHWADGRLHDRDHRGSVIARCITLARMGAAVFSIDMVGYNDSCQLPHRQFPFDAHWGMSMMALQTWNNRCGLDFLLGLPGADPRRVAVTGTSGGGTQSFMLTAVDDRVTVSAPICMVSYQMQGGCLCENAPLLRIDATSVDIARLAAPRPLFLGSCTGDWTKATLTEELPAVRQIYALYGAAARVCNHHLDYEHNYNQEMREHVYGFLNRHLFGRRSDAAIPEKEWSRPPHRDRMVWWGRPAPEPIPYDRFRALWRDRAEAALKPHLRGAAAARAGLGPLVPHALGVTPTSVADHRGRTARAVRIVRDGKRLIVTPTAYRIEVPEKIHYYEAYNRTLFALRVHEILAAVADADGRVTLEGRGAAGPAALAAAAVSPRVAEITADMCGMDPTRDADWKRLMDTPAIRQTGGLAALFALIGTRPLELKGTRPSLAAVARKYAR